jgi:hypothetical protein
MDLIPGYVDTDPNGLPISEMRRPAAPGPV